MARSVKSRVAEHNANETVSILGGTGNLYGALLGTIVFMVARNFLSDINPQYWQFWLGILLIVIVLFGREGVMGVLRGIAGRLSARRRAKP